jgi:hypothetical protein
MTVPDFFLSAAREYKPLSQPRACWEKARLRDSKRDDHMLVEITPILVGQNFGLGEDISQLILSARHEGFSLYPIREWPSHVYVSRIKDKTILKTCDFDKTKIELIAWASIFRTLEEAEAYSGVRSPT